MANTDRMQKKNNFWVCAGVIHTITNIAAIDFYLQYMNTR